MGKLIELLALVLFGCILAIAVLYGLKLDNAAQDMQQDSWNLSPLSPLSSQGEGKPEQFGSHTITQY
jgi:hypothetical protein